MGHDYYPFGMMMQGRHYSASSGYRYGFNGKEIDNETYGDGNVYDYGFRIYNPRLGRFLSVDPLTKNYPWYTPYQFGGNKPIIAIDLDGMEELVVVATGKTVKPVTATESAINLSDRFNVGQAAIHHIVSQLQLKEIQQKQVVAPTRNIEWGAADLTPAESREIIEETVAQFTIYTEARSEYHESPNLSVITETYTRIYSFNYSLLGSENTIHAVKEVVSTAATVTEYAADVSGSKILNKVSAPTGLVANAMNEDYVGISEYIATTLAEKGIKFAASKIPWLAPFAGKVAGGTVQVLSLSLTNSGPPTVIDLKENKKEDLRNRTIAALLFLFHNSNKLKVQEQIKPATVDNTYHAPAVVPPESSSGP